MIACLILIPLLAGIAVFVMNSVFWSFLLLAGAAGIHSVMTIVAWIHRPSPLFNGWFQVDDLGLIFLTITSLLFLMASFYAVGYLKREGAGQQKDDEEGLFFQNSPHASFVGSLLLFLSTMSLVIVSHHFGIFWVAMEATTLASAPLIYYHRHHRSLEATWKYLIICSVGIAFALMGNFLLAVSIPHTNGEPIPLVLSELQKHGPVLMLPWVKVAFIFFLAGYGTKMGLAPMHTWLPDAHSESPSVVSALLSGALLNCAFLGILRGYQVCMAAGLTQFCQTLLVAFGLFSMAVAAIFIVGQTDYKRILAYSSVEHMGIMALGIGLGGQAVFGSMLHSLNHSLTKGMLFLVAGNILALFRTKTCSDIRGILKITPVTGVLWLVGFLAITGSPPFGIFLSEFTILKAALDAGRYSIAIAYMLLLSIIFVGMAFPFLSMAQGNPSNAKISHSPRSVTLLTLLPPVLLGAGCLCLGLYIPPFLNTLLHLAAQSIGG